MLNMSHGESRETHRETISSSSSVCSCTVRLPRESHCFCPLSASVCKSSPIGYLRARMVADSLQCRVLASCCSAACNVPYRAGCTCISSHISTLGKRAYFNDAVRQHVWHSMHVATFNFRKVYVLAQPPSVYSVRSP